MDENELSYELAMRHIDDYIRHIQSLDEGLYTVSGREEHEDLINYLNVPGRKTIRPWEPYGRRGMMEDPDYPYAESIQDAPGNSYWDNIEMLLESLNSREILVCLLKAIEINYEILIDYFAEHSPEILPILEQWVSYIQFKVPYAALNLSLPFSTSGNLYQLFMAEFSWLLEHLSRRLVHSQETFELPEDAARVVSILSSIWVCSRRPDLCRPEPWLAERIPEEYWQLEERFLEIWWDECRAALPFENIPGTFLE